MNAKCKHCGRELTSGEHPVHAEGDYRGKNRCCPGDSGLPYGYEAVPEGTECSYPCLGASSIEPINH